jgi:hypothetical protein
MRAENIAMEQAFSAKLDDMENRTSAEIKEVKGSIGEVEGNITMLQNEVDKNEDILQRVSESRTASATNTRSIPRNSLLFSQLEPSQRVEQDAAAPFRFIAVTQAEVKDDEKLKKLTLRSFIYIKNRLSQRMAASPGDPKRLVHFINHDTLADLVNNEQVKKTQLSKLLNCTNIYNLSDEDITSVAARKLRPLTFKMYEKTIFKSVTTYKPAIKGWELKVEGYHDAIFTVVNKIIEEVQDFDAFFREDASPEELSNLPKLNYGRSTTDDAGVFRIALQCLGEACVFFTNEITEERLRQFTTMKQLVDAVKVVNDEQARQSRAFLRTSQNMAPRVKLEDTYRKVQQEMSDYTNRRSSLDPDTRGERKHSFKADSGFNLLGEPNGDSHDEVEFVEDNPMHDSPTACLEEHFVYASDEDDDADAEFVDAQIRRFSGGDQSRDPREKTYKDKPRERILVCFEKYKNSVCQAGDSCIYSHDDAILRKYAAKRLFEDYNSAYTDKKCFAYSPPEPPNESYRKEEGKKQAQQYVKTGSQQNFAPNRKLYRIAGAPQTQDVRIHNARKSSIILG